MMPAQTFSIKANPGDHDDPGVSLNLTGDPTLISEQYHKPLLHCPGHMFFPANIHSGVLASEESPETVVYHSSQRWGVSCELFVWNP